VAAAVEAYQAEEVVMVVDEAYLVDEAVLPVEEEAVETMEDYSSFNFVGIFRIISAEVQRSLSFLIKDRCRW
jgi:hypothetical protein